MYMGIPGLFNKYNDWVYQGYSISNNSLNSLSSKLALRYAGRKIKFTIIIKLSFFIRNFAESEDDSPCQHYDTAVNNNVAWKTLLTKKNLFKTSLLKY